MLRDKSLIPLSRQHQHALALCVRIDRAVQAGEVELEAWQAEIREIFEREIAIHFAAEEKELFPAAGKFAELEGLVQDLLLEHGILGAFFARATKRELDANDLGQFAQTLSAHIRKEERQLFEQMQRLMTAAQLASLGEALGKELERGSKACIVPSPATRLRSGSKT